MKPKPNDAEKKSLLKARSDRISRPYDSDKMSRPSDRIDRPVTNSSSKPGGNLPPLSSADLDERVRSVASHASSMTNKQPNPRPLGNVGVYQGRVDSRGAQSVDEPLIAHMTLRGALSTAIDSGLDRDVVLASRRNKLFSGNSFAWGIFASSKNVNSERVSSELPVHEANRSNKPVRTIKLQGVQYTSDVKWKRRIGRPLILFFLIAAIVATGVGVGVANRSNNSASCGSSSEDLSIRQSIASEIEFQDNGDATTTAIVTGSFLSCLPANAFAELSESQLTELEASTGLSITRVGLQILDDKAFNGPDFSNIIQIDLKENGLSSIPDGALRPYFPALLEIDLSDNAFASLDNDIFGGLPLNKILFESNGIVRFPQALRGAPGIVELTFKDCSSLIEIERDYFKGRYAQLNSIDLTNTPAFLQYVDEAGFREHSGLIDDERAAPVQILTTTP